MPTRPSPLFVLLIVLPLLLLLPVPGYTHIRLRAAEAEQVLLDATLTNQTPLTYTWTNSIYRIPIREVYFAENGNLVLRQIQSGENPPPATGDISDLYHPGDAFSTTQANLPFSNITFRVGEIGNPVFRLGDKQISLKEQAGFGGQVTLQARPARVYEVLWKK